MAASGCIRNDNVVFYHALDDYTEDTQSQTWNGSSAFVVGKLNLAGTSAAAVAAYEFGTPQSGFNQTGCYTEDWCAVTPTKIVASTYYGRVGDISGSTVNWSDLGPIIGTQNHNLIFPLTWDDVAETGHVFTAAWSSAGKETIKIVNVSGQTLTVVDNHACNAGNGPIYTQAMFGVMSDMSGNIPSGHIVMGAYGQACILTIENDTISSGVTNTSGVGNYYCHAVEGIDDTHAVALFSDQKMYLLTLDYGSNSIVISSGYDTNMTLPSLDPNSSVYHSKLVHVSGDKFMALYRAADKGGYAQVWEVSGSVLNSGALVQFALGSNVSPPPPNWTTNSIYGSKINDSSIFIDYNHYDNGAALSYSKYCVATIDDMSISLSNELVRYAHPDYYGGGRAKMISPTMVFAHQVNRRVAAPIWDQYYASGTPTFGFNLTASDESVYPDASGSEHVTVAMWAKNITTGESIFTVERDYEINLTPSSITLGSGTAIWQDAGVSGVIATMNDGDDHFLALDFEHTGSDNWDLRTSVDGSGWVNQGVQNQGSQPIVSGQSDPSMNMADTTNDEWIDELIMWGGTYTRFTDLELAILEDLADGKTQPMNQYQNYNYLTASSGIDLLIIGPLPWTSGADLYIEGPAHSQYQDMSGYPMDRLLRTQDYDPQIIGLLDIAATSATITVWNIINGVNVEVPLASDVCYAIGDTLRWGWSTANSFSEYLSLQV